MSAEGGIPELPNVLTILHERMRDVPAIVTLHTWQNVVFSLVVATGLTVFMRRAFRRPALFPTGLQNFAEAIVEGLDDLVCGIMGKEEGRRYVPFIGSLFLYIFTMNWLGLVPGLKSPTANINITGGMAVAVFLYVQWTGLRRLGAGGYLHHLAGSPEGVVGWLLAPLFLVLHILGEFIKPVSLSLRLFGNIMGEDVLIGVFAMMGVALMAAVHVPVGVPLHLPFLLLAMLTGTIQALVFSLLSTIYIFLMLPHEEGHGEHLLKKEVISHG
ncbi:MAG: F0F1 ATP synthase subunit A [Planctomycetota bacterium]